MLDFVALSCFRFKGWRYTSSRFTSVTAFSFSVKATLSLVPTTKSFLPSFTIESRAASPWKADRPATSPSFILLTSILMIPSQVGPSVRVLMVLGARKMLGTTRDVFRRSQPLRSVSDQALSTGLWFHCHCNSSLSFEKSSLYTSPLPSYPNTGFCILAGILPFSSVSIGHPSFQVHGSSVSTLPTPPRSWNTMPYQLPSLSSTIVPCPTPLNPANSVSRITFFS